MSEIYAIESGRKIMVEAAAPRLRDMYGGAVRVDAIDHPRAVGFNLDADDAEALAVALREAAALSRDAYAKSHP